MATSSTTYQDPSWRVDAWAAAAIRIASRELSPEEITKRLGVPPTSEFLKGTLMSPRNAASRHRSKHLWVLDSGVPETAPMSDHLAALRLILEPRRDALRSLGEAVTIDLFLGYHQSSTQGSFTVDASLVRLLGEIGAAVVLDIHAE